MEKISNQVIAADWKLKTVVTFTALSMLLIYLPFIRGIMDGDSYSWSTYVFGFPVSGRGMAGGNYPFLVVGVIYAMTIYYSAYRLEDRRIFFVLSMAWHLCWLVTSLRETLLQGFYIEGDTMGFKINAGWLFVLLTAIPIVFIIKSFLQGRTGPVYHGPMNARLLTIVLALLPVQFMLLYFGLPGTVMDESGVSVTIVQCLLLPKIFKNK